MTSLTKFLSAIAEGLAEQTTALSGDDPGAETPESLALRDYHSQLLAVADAVRPDGTVEWARLDDLVGVDLEPEPASLIRVVFGQGDVEGMAEKADIPIEAAEVRAERWGDAIEQTATELCSPQLLSVIKTGQP